MTPSYLSRALHSAWGMASIVAWRNELDLGPPSDVDPKPITVNFWLLMGTADLSFNLMGVFVDGATLKSM